MFCGTPEFPGTLVGKHWYSQGRSERRDKCSVSTSPANLHKSYSFCM
jgi:hypothetical protein